MNHLLCRRFVACGLAVKQSLDLGIGKLHAVHLCHIHIALALAVEAELTIEKNSIFEDRFTVDFKSGITIDIEA